MLDRPLHLCSGTETLGPLHYYTKPGSPPFNSPQQMALFAVAGLAVRDADSLLHRLGSQSYTGDMNSTFVAGHSFVTLDQTCRL